MSGIDLEMAMADPAYGYLPAALEAGQVSEAAIDACVRRVLRAKLQLGLFDNPYVDEDRAAEVLADPAHREIARVAAERSAVLLRNEADLLPLSAESLSAASGSIAVIGPLADSRRDTIGPWVFDFDLDETVTVLDGHPAAGRHDRHGWIRTGHPAGAAALRRRCSTCSPATRRPIPVPTSTTTRSCSGRSSWPAPPTSRWSCSGSGRT